MPSNRPLRARQTESSKYYPSNAFKGLDSHSVSVYGDSVNTLNWLIDHVYHDEISG